MTDGFLNDTQRKTLSAVMETLIPAFPQAKQQTGFWHTSAGKFIPELAEEILADVREDERADIIRLLNVLENPLSGLLTFGAPKAFTKLDPKAREERLLRWANSSIPDLRKAFQAIKRLTGLLYFGHSVNGRNPAWEAIGYPGPPKVKEHGHSKYAFLHPTQDDFEYGCDVVVIGSGAGGGLVAFLLAMKGLEVIVVEKGNANVSADFDGLEIPSLKRSFEKSGLQTNQDGSMTIFSGSGLGGGTAINWTASLRTPDFVLEEWAREHGNAHFLSDAYRKEMDWVEDYFRVNTDNSMHNPQNQKLWKGSETLGQHVDVIPRNVAGCFRSKGNNCGWCGFGCREGNKRGTLETCLPDACSLGAKILGNAFADKVIVKEGKAAGVEVRVGTKDGEVFTGRINARKVVVACGSIHSPLLLERSGISHPQIGKNLYLHPVLGSGGIYPEVIAPWSGVMMSAVNTQYHRVNGNYGFWIETPPIHPGVIASALPWEGSLAYRKRMLQAKNLGMFIVLTRDRFGGEVKAAKDGKAFIRYNLHPSDKKIAIQGVAESVRLHLAAGATEVFAAHQTVKSFKQGVKDTEIRSVSRKLKWTSNRYAFFSAHQMGTVRMGGDNSKHPVSPEGKVRGVQNLFVADASLFPSAVGVNPMMSIFAISKWVASHIS